MNYNIFLSLFVDSYEQTFPAEYYVYVLLDPRKPGIYTYGNISFSYEPFYVGKGKNKRAETHLNFTDNTGNPFKTNKINKIYSENMVIVIEKPYLNIRENQSFIIEKTLIKMIGRVNTKTGPLCNLTDGGEGSSGVLVLMETREKHSKASKGRKLSEEWKQKISKSEKGKVISKDQREKISNTLKRKYKNKEIKIKIHKHTEEEKKIISKKSKEMWLNNYDKMKQTIVNSRVKRTKESYAIGSEKTKKEYRITNLLTNEIYIIKGLAEFCRDNGLCRRHALSLISQNKKYKNFLIERIGPKHK